MTLLMAHLQTDRFSPLYRRAPVRNRRGAAGRPLGVIADAEDGDRPGRLVNPVEQTRREVVRDSDRPGAGLAQRARVTLQGRLQRIDRPVEVLATTVGPCRQVG